MIVNYRCLREQAYVIAKEHCIETEEFKCSDKWIHNFMKRNRLSVRKIMFGIETSENVDPGADEDCENDESEVITDAEFEIATDEDIPFLT